MLISFKPIAMKKHFTSQNLRRSALLFALLTGTVTWAQNVIINGPYEVPSGISYHRVATESNPVVVSRSGDIIQKMASRNACATINVNYAGNVPANAIPAFEFAAGIWAAALDSSVPITVNVEFIDLPSDVVASAEPNGYFTISGIGLPDTLYPRALAEALRGTEIGGANSLDMTISFNDALPFYYGTDENPAANEYDFVTLALHNMGHGLGFIGFGISDGSDGSIRDTGTGYPSIYDSFVENGAGASILSFADPSAALHAELTGDDLFIDATNANSANGGNVTKIHAPDPFSFFKSYDHWDSSVFPPSNPNSLMTETIALGQVNHNPGEVTLGFLSDMGWTLCQTLGTTRLSVAQFQLLENPVNDDLRLQLPAGASASNYKARIFNMSGQIVYESDVSTSNQTLVISNLDALTSGVYFLQLQDASGGANSHHRFVKY